jgi:hypothetical protein
MATVGIYRFVSYVKSTKIHGLSVKEKEGMPEFVIQDIIEFPLEFRQNGDFKANTRENIINMFYRLGELGHDKVEVHRIGDLEEDGQ